VFSFCEEIYTEFSLKDLINKFVIKYPPKINHICRIEAVYTGLSPTPANFFTFVSMPKAVIAIVSKEVSISKHPKKKIVGCFNKNESIKYN